MKQILILLGVLAFLAVAAAQTMDVAKPADRQYDTGHCYEYQVKMLTAATNTGNSLEDMQKFEIAARAYEKLDAIGQAC